MRGRRKKEAKSEGEEEERRRVRGRRKKGRAETKNIFVVSRGQMFSIHRSSFLQSLGGGRGEGGCKFVAKLLRSKCYTRPGGEGVPISLRFCFVWEQK